MREIKFFYDVIFFKKYVILCTKPVYCVFLKVFLYSRIAPGGYAPGRAMRKGGYAPDITVLHYTILSVTIQQYIVLCDNLHYAIHTCLFFAGR